MYFSAVDFGSSTFRALIGETRKNGGLTILDIFKVPAIGMRKGEIVSVEESLVSVNQILARIKEHHKSAARNIFAGVGGANVRHQHSRGIVAVSRADNEIYDDDIERVIKASQALNLGPNRMILHTLTKEFTVDGASGIADPLGMVGNRLEVQSLVIDAFKATVNNILKSIEAGGGRVTGLVYNPLASSRAVLTKAQKELGVVSVDIGSGTTGMAVYEEGELLSATVFPVGATNITNDLAIGLKCSPKTAQRIQFSFGAALAKDVSAKDKIELGEFDPSLRATVSRKFVAEIIEVRLAEIFELVNNELKLIGKMGELPAGVVLTGGGAKIAGIVELVKQEMKLGGEIGTPDTNDWEIISQGGVAELDDPEFSVVAGLLRWASDRAPGRSSWEAAIPSDSWISRTLRHFLP
ncbi:cell division protein FtsA [Candidatus Wolfebacteria bacterium]|nr:cell division protein FtsA [Candidatus Wolfebacteria bacterium]